MAKSTASGKGQKAKQAEQDKRSYFVVQLLGVATLVVVSLAAMAVLNNF